MAPHSPWRCYWKNNTSEFDYSHRIFNYGKIFNNKFKSKSYTQICKLPNNMRNKTMIKSHKDLHCSVYKSKNSVPAVTHF